MLSRSLTKKEALNGCEPALPLPLEGEKKEEKKRGGKGGLCDGGGKESEGPI